MHCLFELRLGRPAEVGKDGVESEELVEVAVAANRRGMALHSPSASGRSVPRVLRAVCVAPRLQVAGQRWAGDCRAPRAPRSSSVPWDLRIRIVDDQRQAFCAAGWFRPGKRRRNVLAFTSAARRDFTTLGESWRGEAQGHGCGSLRVDTGGQRRQQMDERGSGKESQHDVTFDGPAVLFREPEAGLSPGAGDSPGGKTANPAQNAKNMSPSAVAADKPPMTIPRDDRVAGSFCRAIIRTRAATMPGATVRP